MRQLLAHHMVQLARSQPGLANAPIANQRHHRLGSALTLGVALLVLVVRLAAVPHIPASPHYAQPLDEPLREDLPEGFFTTRTP